MPNEKGTTVHALQTKFQSVFGFTLPLFHGRGLLNCTSTDRGLLPALDHPDRLDNLGLMPYRRRIVSVSKFFRFVDDDTP
jgi:2-acylglycerol O-acyltransferase 2